MAAFHPVFETLPAEIAVFPLPGALLLPRGRLPLNIFEPRYLAMVQESLAPAAGRMFGMIQPDPSAPRVDGGPGLYRVGCLGRLSSFSETEDGRLLITLSGVARFRLAEELPLAEGGYRRVRPDYAPFRADLDLSAPAAPVDRAALMAALRPFFRLRRIEVNWEAMERTSDALLVLTLAMVCPFGVPEKQALLEAETEAARAAMLITLLQMGAHEAPGGGNGSDGGGGGDLPPGRKPS